MNIKFAKEIIKEVEERKPIKTSDKCVNGEEFEKWIHEDLTTERLLNIAIELDARETSNNCVVPELIGKNFEELCNEGIRILEELKKG